MYGMAISYLRCGKVASWRKADLCRVCSKICACGRPKQHQAKRCCKCLGLERRRKWDDLRWELFSTVRAGRFYAYYWTEDGTQRTLSRYQWVWEKAHDPVPPGYEIHHKNEHHADDRLDNLELLPKGYHRKLHGQLKSDRSDGPPEWTC